MTEIIKPVEHYIFDQSILHAAEKIQAAEAHDIGSLVLDISQLTIDFSDIDRKPRYYDHKPENNAEHSFMLGLAVMEIGKKYYPGLDVGLMAQFALVHDLVELKTNDIATFDLDEAGYKAKHEAEQLALKELAQTLPPHIADMLLWYEDQKEPEALLVRHVDKLLPYAVDINGAGLTVMREDYGVTSAKQLMKKNAALEVRFDKMFPDPEHKILRKAHQVLANRFALEFDEA